MPERELCFCEYFNEDGEKSHLLEALCNCYALDKIFDSIFKRETIDNSLWSKLLHTVSDRMRVPWFGGALKLSPSISSAIIIIPCLFYLGAISLLSSIFTYFLILPATVYFVGKIYRELMRKSRSDAENSDGLKSQYYMFYPAFLASSIFWLYTFYLSYIIHPMKINTLEAFFLFSLCGFSSFWFYLCKKKSTVEYGVAPENESLYIDGGDSFKHCNECRTQVTSHSTHCRRCSGCFPLKDHHCLWLNCCISSLNDREFVYGCILISLHLWYGLYLTVTMVCVPRFLFYKPPFSLIVPSDCSNAYATWNVSIITSVCWYLFILATSTSVLTLVLLARIAFGHRAKHKQRLLVNRKLPSQIAYNFYRFFYLRKS